MKRTLFVLAAAVSIAAGARMAAQNPPAPGGGRAGAPLNPCRSSLPASERATAPTSAAWPAPTPIARRWHSRRTRRGDLGKLT